MIVGDLLKNIGRAVKRLFTKKTTIEKAFDTQIAVSGKMENSINLWAEMYENRPPWKSESIKTLNLPASIASEIARLVTMEMKVEITGSPMADYLNKQIKGCLERSRQYTEFACAKGGIILKPFVIPDEGKIGITVVQPEDFYPTKFDSNGEITGGMFPDQKIIGNRKYTRIEWHELDGSNYRIINKVFVTETSEIDDVNDNILGKEVTLAEVPGWESIEPEVNIGNVEVPLFAYFKMPMSNNVELRSPLGVSAYAKAVELIKEADKQWSNILWEYEATQAAVFGDEDVFMTDRYGNVKLEGREKRLFRTFEGLEKKLQEYNPTIRDTSLFNGLDKILKQIEFVCSLAYGTISDPQNTDKTATEVKQSKQRSFSLVCDIQKSFQTAHEHLIKAMNILAMLYDLAPDGEYEVMFDFDDSIVVDREVEFKRLMQMASAKMIRAEKVVAWYFGISEEEAKEMLPPAFDSNDPDDDKPENEEE